MSATPTSGDLVSPDDGPSEATAPHTRQDEATRLTSLPHSSPIRKRKRGSRAKSHSAWQQHDLQSDGLYSRYLQELAARFPQLTPMELRIAALIKGALPSWEIANILYITEATVENHRVNIRRKIGLNIRDNLATHLIGLKGSAQAEDG
jgi:DNA-binding CsgD family transcriptional regulator